MTAGLLELVVLSLVMASFVVVVICELMEELLLATSDVVVISDEEMTEVVDDGFESVATESSEVEVEVFSVVDLSIRVVLLVRSLVVVELPEEAVADDDEATSTVAVVEEAIEEETEQFVLRRTVDRPVEN